MEKVAHFPDLIIPHDACKKWQHNALGVDWLSYFIIQFQHVWSASSEIKKIEEHERDDTVEMRKISSDDILVNAPSNMVVD